MRRHLMGAVVLGGLLMAQASAAAVTARAIVSRTQVRLDEPLELRVHVEGAQQVAAPMVAAEGFAVRYIGPATQISLINGQMSASVTHTYLLLPQQPGQWTIGPITVKAGETTLQTEPVTVEVLSTGSPRQLPQEEPGTAPEAGGSLQLQLGLDRAKAYVNERVPMTVQLLIDGMAVRSAEPPALQADGFQVGPIRSPIQSDVAVDGRPPLTLIEFKTSVAATRPGRLTLGPASMLCQVTRRRQLIPFDDLFEQAFLEPVIARAEPVAFEAVPFPQAGRPKIFDGAVGRFTLEVDAAPTTVVAGEPVTLRLRIRGEGNHHSVTAPTINAGRAKIRLGQPQQRSQPVFDEGQGPPPMDEQLEETVFEQQLIPLNVSVKAVPEVQFAFLDPAAGAYQTLTHDPIPLTVQPAPKPKVAAPAIPEPPLSGRPGPPWLAQWRVSALAGAAAAMAVTALLIAWLVRRFAAGPSAAVRTARRLARRGRTAQAADALSAALERAAASPHASPELAREAAELLRRCAAARSAPASVSAQQLPALLQDVQALLAGSR